MRTTRTTRASDRALPHLPADPSPRSPSRSRSSSLSSPEPDPSSYRTPAKKRARTTPIKKEPLSSKKPKKGTPTSPVKKPRAASPKFAAYLETPYPDYARPTTEDCQEVTTRLAGLHGLPVRPGEVKKEITGSIGEACGAVPSVLDALIRTILSQNTTSANSTRAYASLLERFGDSPDQAKAVDLLAVFRAPVGDVFESIKCGGLATVKSKVIKNVLQQVRDRNLRVEGGEDPSIGEKKVDVDVKQEEEEDDGDGGNLRPLKKVESLSDDEERRLLSLDYVHGLSDEAAMKELESFKGVGPKTASCVLLFCLSRDSFAVDTHVFRLSKALGWVPPRATRETAYEHLDVRIPSELKYSLHVLLIAHGKSCPRCAASKKTTRPLLGPCPLVGLAKGSSSGAADVKEEADDGDASEDKNGLVAMKPESDDDAEAAAGFGGGEKTAKIEREDVEEAMRVHGAA